MSIKYSGHPCRLVEYPMDTSLMIESAIQTNLVVAGWTDLGAVNPLPSWAVSGYAYKSMRTPQGLQAAFEMYRHSNLTDLYSRIRTVDGTIALGERWLLTRARPGYLQRLLANGYQFFTHCNKDSNSTAAVLCLGVPWLSDFIQPLRVVSVTLGSPVEITTYEAHGWVTGTPIIIEGAEGISGLNRSWTATVTGSESATLDGSSILSGSYVPFTAVVAGPGKVARFTWAQSTGYYDGWLMSSPAETWRSALDSAPKETYFSYKDLGCNAAILNSGCWTIPNTFGYANKAGAVRLFQVLPYNRKWYGDAVVGFEPLITAGEGDMDSPSKIIGQLWDAIACNATFPVLDQVLRFDNASWHVFTNNLTDDGSLLLKIDVG